MQTKNFTEVLNSKNLKQLKTALHIHEALQEQIFLIARSPKDRVSVAVLLNFGNDVLKADHFEFDITAVEIPAEFQTFLNDYATRLIAECHLLRGAIEDLRSQFKQIDNDTNRLI